MGEGKAYRRVLAAGVAFTTVLLFAQPAYATDYTGAFPLILVPPCIIMLAVAAFATSIANHRGAKARLPVTMLLGMLSWFAFVLLILVVMGLAAQPSSEAFAPIFALVTLVDVACILGVWILFYRSYRRGKEDAAKPYPDSNVEGWPYFVQANEPTWERCSFKGKLIAACQGYEDMAIVIYGHAAGEQALAWLTEKSEALDGRRPSELLASSETRDELRETLLTMA